MAAPEDPEHGDNARSPKKNHLISRKLFRSYIVANPEAAKDKATFDWWCKNVEKTVWKKFADVRATFGSADQVRSLVVFNLAGNTYRVITRIDYKRARVFVKRVLTHEEYDKGQWKDDA